MRVRWIACWTLLAVVGCGPSVGGVEPSSDTEMAPPETTTGTPGAMTTTTTTSAGPPADTTSSVTVGPSDGTTAGASSDGADEGRSFIETPDGGSSCSVCDTWGQNCPGGEKCVPWEGGCGARCVELVPDAGGPGDPCTFVDRANAMDDCDASSICWDVDPASGEGTCVAFCAGSEDNPECDDGMACLVAEPFFNVCLPACDPLAPACPAGQACFTVRRGFACVDDSAAFQIGHCVVDSSCPPASACMRDRDLAECEESWCCTPVCNLDAPDPDASCPGVAAGDVCRPYYAAGTAPAGQMHVGVCALP